MRAVPLWKNRHIFYDLTKQTSIPIHSLPAIVVCCIGWCRQDIELPDRLNFVLWIVYPLGFSWF